MGEAVVELHGLEVVDRRVLLLLRAVDWRLLVDDPVEAAAVAVTAPGLKDMEGEEYWMGDDDLCARGGEQRCGWERKVGGESEGCLAESGEDCA